MPPEDVQILHHDDGLDRAATVRATTEALRLCLAGDGAAGLALYRDAASTKNVHTVSLGFQARLIEQAGHTETARQLRNLAARRGFDVSWQNSLDTALPAATVAATYEQLFATGYANSLMIDRYARALTTLGRTADVAALFDVPRLLHRRTLGDAAAIAEALAAAETDMPYKDRVQISYAMRSLDRLHALRHPVYDALLEAVRAEMSAYLARLAHSDHPLAALVPQDFSIEAWGMASRADGHNVRHHHPRGWVTAVYYPAALPPGSVGGALRVGGWSDPAPPGWPDEAIQPAPGLLVLMPSWYVHWTEPTQSDGLRLSIAIDAVRN